MSSSKQNKIIKKKKEKKQSTLPSNLFTRATQAVSPWLPPCPRVLHPACIPLGGTSGHSTPSSLQPDARLCSQGAGFAAMLGGCSWQKHVGLRCGMLQLSSEIKIERKNTSHTISHSPMETKSLLRERYHVHPRKGEGDWQLPMLTATSSSNASGATQSHHSWPVQHQICIHQLASLKPAAWHRFGQRHTCQENRAEHCRRQMWQYDLQKCTPSAATTVEG